MWLLLLACAPGPADGRVHEAAAGLAARTWPGPPEGLPALQPRDVDVLVIGAGPAGMAAAIEAHHQGASVILLEREATVGGAYTGSGGLMMFSGTPEQLDRGVSDSPETLLAEWPALTGGDPDDEWVRRFAYENVPEVHDWLSGMGLRWFAVDVDASGGALARIHTVEGLGAALVATLAAHLPPGCLRTRVQAEGLVREDGRVVGVDWTRLDTGSGGTTFADAVVVATGGFMHDLDKVREVRPDLADLDLRWASWTGSDGNGLDLLLDEGATVQNLDAVGLYAHGVPTPPSDPEPHQIAVDFLYTSPWVDETAQRFLDEGVVNAFPTASTVAEHGGAWVIFDDRAGRDSTWEARDGADSTYTWEEVRDGGSVVSADDLRGLADALGLDPDVLSATVAAFNGYAAGELEDPWRTTSVAVPVSAPPFHATPVAVSAAKGFGGIDVDLDGAVLDEEGAPMPGLYAAGELAGMAGGSLVGENGFTGSVSAVLLSGRVAGRSAAAASRR